MSTFINLYNPHIKPQKNPLGPLPTVFLEFNKKLTIRFWDSPHLTLSQKPLSRNAMSISPHLFSSLSAVCFDAVISQADGNLFSQLTDIFLEAVEYDGLALQFVPEAARTPEICLAAVNECSDAIMHVPVEAQTPEVRHAAGLKSIP